MNNCNFVGRITRDLELKYTTNGVSYVRFTLAISRVGKQKETTDFIDMIAWRGLADNMSKYCSKGSQISVTGMLQSNNYTDSNGKKQYSMNVVADNVQFLSKKKKGENSNAIKLNLTDDNLPF